MRFSFCHLPCTLLQAHARGHISRFNEFHSLFVWNLFWVQCVRSGAHVEKWMKKYETYMTASSEFRLLSQSKTIAWISIMTFQPRREQISSRICVTHDRFVENCQRQSYTWWLACNLFVPMCHLTSTQHSTHSAQSTIIHKISNSSSSSSFSSCIILVTSHTQNNKKLFLRWHIFFLQEFSLLFSPNRRLSDCVCGVCLAGRKFNEWMNESVWYLPLKMKIIHRVPPQLHDGGCDSARVRSLARSLAYCQFIG